MPDQKAPKEQQPLQYTPIFDPDKPKLDVRRVLDEVSIYARPRTNQPYVYHLPDIALAVNVALATKRPLLLGGRPGSGKSTLARHIASCLGWEYQEETITSRTQANDLLWRFDSLKRLSDASTPKAEVLAESEYVEPGILWWAFDPVSAYKSSPRLRNQTPPEALANVKGVVVLLDEIDKAEPDVPNDLLVPIGDSVFHPRGHSAPVSAKLDYLLCITTNGERELPQAFVRRCVTLSVKRPSEANLRKIAVMHNEGLEETSEVLGHVLTAFNALEKEMVRQRRRPPSTAEFLDAVRACLKLRPTEQAEMAQFTMQKIIDIQEAEE